MKSEPPYVPNLLKVAKRIAQNQEYTSEEEIINKLLGYGDHVSRPLAETVARMALNELHDEGVGLYYKILDNKDGAPVFKCLGDEKED